MITRAKRLYSTLVVFAVLVSFVYLTGYLLCSSSQVRPEVFFYRGSGTTRVDRSSRALSTNSSLQSIKVAILIDVKTVNRTLNAGVSKEDTLLASYISSINRTIEREYQYAAYFGVHDNVVNISALLKHLDSRIRIVVLRSTPGNTFNALAHQANMDGADYLVIISDHSEFMTAHWTSTAINTLLGHKPANVGVVGARCSNGSVNKAYSIVHRTHMDVFSQLLPLKNMDGKVHVWLSAVYQPHYTSLTRTCSAADATINIADKLHTTALGDTTEGSVSQYRANLNQYLIRKTLSYISNVPKVVWAFWFGPPMEGKRLQAWRSLKANIGAPIKLVTEKDLHLYNVSSHPMHRALSLKKGMSMNHRSDYCRVYFMHHFGGGYHDIKWRNDSWATSFDVFTDPDVWVYGIPESSSLYIGCDESYVLGDLRCDKARAVNKTVKCCPMVRRDWRKLVSNCAYMARPNTNLTYEWLQNVEDHLTRKYEQLKRRPAPRPRCCQRQPEGYPFYWTEVHGAAFHPLQWKYMKHVRPGLPDFNKNTYRDKDGKEDQTIR